VDDLKRISIVIPPLDEQAKIIAILDAKIPLLEKTIKSKEQLLLALEEYKKSLIYECVTGKREVV
jgi:type I restriction enzyme S subunit